MKLMNETNSKSDYEGPWLNHKTKTTCCPNKADLELHEWEPQGKPWEAGQKYGCVRIYTWGAVFFQAIPDR
jgi:hypothetical protein